MVYLNHQDMPSDSYITDSDYITEWLSTQDGGGTPELLKLLQLSLLKCQHTSYMSKCMYLIKINLRCTPRRCQKKNGFVTNFFCSEVECLVTQFKICLGVTCY